LIGLFIVINFNLYNLFFLLFFKFQDDPESSIQIHSRSSIRKHTSVIKNLSFSVGLNKLLFTSGACEELNAWKLEIKDNVSDMMCDSDLYINCVSYVSAPHVSPVTSETRIMDMDVVSLGSLKLREYANDNGIHLVIAGYSDSLTRVSNHLRKKYLLVYIYIYF